MMDVKNAMHLTEGGKPTGPILIAISLKQSEICVQI